MAEIELDAVVEFLRKNGLTESESALVEDVLEKSDLGSSLLDKFFFPMVTPPPPVRIPGNSSPRMGSGGFESLDGSSDDDFVSLGSSAAELYPSEFINPYGILATRPASRASSRNSSQFGTARDYADFDMQNDLFWYKERDEDYAMPPLFVAGDMAGEPSEDKTGFEENKDFPIVISSIIAGRYYVTEYIGSAAFSKVVQAHDLQLGIDVCLKIIKNDKEFFDQSLDEIKLLKFVNKHDPTDSHHILRLYDYFYFQEHLLIVTELLGANLYEYQKFIKESGGEPYFTMPRLQAITRQCLEALCYLHDLGIIHCDLKPENILLKSYRRCEIKIIDLGSSCFLTDNLSVYIQSRSYRAPEVMLGLPYNQKIDLWSIGCIIAELYSGEVLFPNEAVVIILGRVMGILGPIEMRMLEDGQETHQYFTEGDYQLFYLNEETNEVKFVIPEASSLENELQVVDDSSGFVDFLKCLLEINPKRRPTAREALKHPWLA
ncbi:hypothetical protein M569_01993, partial [Genlisea aurea]